MTKEISDACEILDRIFGPLDPTEFQQEKERVLLGCQIYEGRKKMGLSRAELAAMVGTKTSVIFRLEHADYKRYPMKTLQKIAAVLGQQIEVRMVSELAGT